MSLHPLPPLSEPDTSAPTYENTYKDCVLLLASRRPLLIWLSQGIWRRWLRRGGSHRLWSPSMSLPMPPLLTGTTAYFPPPCGKRHLQGAGRWGLYVTQICHTWGTRGRVGYLIQDHDCVPYMVVRKVNMVVGQIWIPTHTPLYRSTERHQTFQEIYPARDSWISNSMDIKYTMKQQWPWQGVHHIDHRLWFKISQGEEEGVSNMYRKEIFIQEKGVPHPGTYEWGSENRDVWNGQNITPFC